MVEERLCLWDKTTEDYKDSYKKSGIDVKFLTKYLDNLEEQERIEAGMFAK